mmetsp:Transcript_6502/g.23145  ORF Transcript_6502/g.23145 Transcript_6502/m.23145 type:complete len:246 (-) Transcript_6502:4371-5108(-)
MRSPSASRHLASHSAVGLSRSYAAGSSLPAALLVGAGACAATSMSRTNAKMASSSIVRRPVRDHSTSTHSRHCGTTSSVKSVRSASSTSTTPDRTARTSASIARKLSRRRPAAKYACGISAMCASGTCAPEASTSAGAMRASSASRAQAPAASTTNSVDLMTSARIGSPSRLKPRSSSERLSSGVTSMDSAGGAGGIDARSSSDVALPRPLRLPASALAESTARAAPTLDIARRGRSDTTARNAG